MKASEDYRDKNQKELLAGAKLNVDLARFETQLNAIATEEGFDRDKFLLNRITDKLLWVIGKEIKEQQKERAKKKKQQGQPLP